MDKAVQAGRAAPRAGRSAVQAGRDAPRAGRAALQAGRAAPRADRTASRNFTRAVAPVKFKGTAL